jgi:hypothetical protein
VVVDTRLLWEERQRLIEDIRQLADEVLATADDALERVKMPEPLREQDPATESPTAEVELDVLPGGAAGGDSEVQPNEAPSALGPPEPAAEEVESLSDPRRTTPGGEQGRSGPG